MYNSKLKITEKDYNTIEANINCYFDNVSKAEHIQLYENGLFPRADKVKDLNMRFRWDMFYKALGRKCTTLDLNYLNDDHMDSALKNILNTELIKRY